MRWDTHLISYVSLIHHQGSPTSETRRTKISNLQSFCSSFCLHIMSWFRSVFDQNCRSTFRLISCRLRFVVQDFDLNSQQTFLWWRFPQRFSCRLRLPTMKLRVRPRLAKIAKCNVLTLCCHRSDDSYFLHCIVDRRKKLNNSTSLKKWRNSWTSHPCPDKDCFQNTDDTRS